MFGNAAMLNSGDLRDQEKEKLQMLDNGEASS